MICECGHSATSHSTVGCYAVVSLENTRSRFCKCKEFKGEYYEI